MMIKDICYIFVILFLYLFLISSVFNIKYLVAESNRNSILKFRNKYVYGYEQLAFFIGFCVSMMVVPDFSYYTFIETNRQFFFPVILIVIIYSGKKFQSIYNRIFSEVKEC